jgi:hypothetical protein
MEAARHMSILAGSCVCFSFLAVIPQNIKIPILRFLFYKNIKLKKLLNKRIYDTEIT